MGISEISLARGLFRLWIVVMIKSALLAGAGLFALGLPVFAQETSQTTQADRFALENSVLTYGQPMLTLEDARRFSFSSVPFWTESTPLNFLPMFKAAQPREVSASATPDSDLTGRLLDSRPSLVYGGEVSLFYGKSGGKFGREDKLGYVLGEVGSDKFHLTIGASYWESNGQLPHR